MACSFFTSPRLTRASVVAAGLALCAGCIPAGDGVAPPADRIYFPVGLSVSSADTLLVVNSDFDLQFSQGTVQSLDLARVAELSLSPCNVDGDCEQGRRCDTEPSDENGGLPGFVCVEPGKGPCGPLGEKTLAARAVAPGRCRAVDLDEPGDGGASLLADVAETSAFATQGLLVDRPCRRGSEGSASCTDEDGPNDRVVSREGDAFPERLFLPVRGDTTIHYLDIDEDGHFVCGRTVERTGVNFASASSSDLRCSRDYRLATGRTFGRDAEGNLVFTDEPPLPGDLDEEELRDIEEDPTNDFRLQPEPIGIAASAGGRVLAISHQVNGIVSTVMNNWLDRPRLVDVLREDLSRNPVGIAAYPGTADSDEAWGPESTWDFLVTYRSEARVDLLHFRDDGLLEAAENAPSNDGGAAVEIFRPGTELVDTVRIPTNSSGVHSRGLVFDDRLRQAEVAACAGDVDCLEIAQRTPLTVYVTNRSPNSLVVGTTGGTSRLSRTSDLPRFYDTIPLTAGPSRVVLGHVVDEQGERVPRVFVICFDSALIYVYDPERGVMETEIRTGRGPYALAFDPERAVAYVAHFTDSYIGVVSLDQRYLRTFGAMMATLGVPQEPRAAQ